MKKILVLGAGKSSPYLIHYLLSHAEAEDWQVTVADLDRDLAAEQLEDRPRSRAAVMDIRDAEAVRREFADTALVVSMLPPFLHHLVAEACLEHGCHLVTVSYEDEQMRAFDGRARERDLIFLNEMGLDPGIDHMSAMATIQEIRAAGGCITGFRSYGSGVPAPDSIENPMQYVITWNPQNVALAGVGGAIYRSERETKVVHGHRIFQHTWPVFVQGVGRMEAYPNRDSLEYLDTFELQHVDTMIRGTLRYPGYCETWGQIVALGLHNNTVRIPNLQERTYREVLEMFLPLVGGSANLENRVARLLSISPTGRIMDNLRWLGLFSKKRIACRGDTAADMLTALLESKLPLSPTARDMVVLVHELEVDYEEQGRKDLHISTMVHYGDPAGYTAMARTVGLPAGIGVRLILSGEVELRGSRIPHHPSIYGPVLQELEDYGVRFKVSHGSSTEES